MSNQIQDRSSGEDVIVTMLRAGGACNPQGHSISFPPTDLAYYSQQQFARSTSGQHYTTGVPPTPPGPAVMPSGPNYYYYYPPTPSLLQTQGAGAIPPLTDYNPSAVMSQQPTTRQGFQRKKNILSIRDPISGEDVIESMNQEDAGAGKPHSTQFARSTSGQHYTTGVPPIPPGPAVMPFSPNINYCYPTTPGLLQTQGSMIKEGAGAGNPNFTPGSTIRSVGTQQHLAPRTWGPHYRTGIPHTPPGPAMPTVPYNYSQTTTGLPQTQGSMIKEGAGAGNPNFTPGSTIRSVGTQQHLAPRTWGPHYRTGIPHTPPGPAMPTVPYNYSQTTTGLPQTQGSMIKEGAGAGNPNFTPGSTIRSVGTQQHLAPRTWGPHYRTGIPHTPPGPAMPTVPYNYSQTTPGLPQTQGSMIKEGAGAGNPNFTPDSTIRSVGTHQQHVAPRTWGSHYRTGIPHTPPGPAMPTVPYNYSQTTTGLPQTQGSMIKGGDGAGNPNSTPGSTIRSVGTQQELLLTVKKIPNKLTPKNFPEMTNEIMQLPIDSEERLKGVVDLVYKNNNWKPTRNDAKPVKIDPIGKEDQLQQQRNEQQEDEWVKVLPGKRTKQNEKRSKIIKSKMELTTDINPKKKREEPHEQKKENGAGAIPPQTSNKPSAVTSRQLSIPDPISGEDVMESMNQEDGGAGNPQCSQNNWKPTRNDAKPVKIDPIGKEDQLQQQRNEQQEDEWVKVLPGKRTKQNEKRSKIIKSKMELTTDINPKKKREEPHEQKKENGAGAIPPQTSNKPSAVTSRQLSIPDPISGEDVMESMNQEDGGAGKPQCSQINWNDDQQEQQEYRWILDKKTREKEKRAKKRNATQNIINSEIKLTADMNPKKKTTSPVPEVIQDNPYLKKYYAQRYTLFSKYDEGIKLDEVSWYSVTPEEIAKQHASRVRSGLVIIDAFCGAGGNAIQFALNGNKVIAIDIDQRKLDLAKNNASIYGVPADRITFICGDFMKLADTPKADVVFLSPPWGGPGYQEAATYDLNKIPRFMEMMEKSKKITDKIFLYVPKTTDAKKLAALAGEDAHMEKNFVNGELKALTAYYGDWVASPYQAEKNNFIKEQG